MFMWIIKTHPLCEIKEYQQFYLIMTYPNKRLKNLLKKSLLFCLVFILTIAKAFAQPANDNCNSAQLICSNETLQGTTANALPDETICFVPNATVWYTFTTNDIEGSVTVTVTRDSLCNISGATGDGIQGVMLISNDTLGGVGPCVDPTLFSQVSNCPSDTLRIDIVGQIPANSQIWVQIDGILNDDGLPTNCGFDIEISGIPVTINAGDPDQIIQGESIELNGSGVDPGTFSWSPTGSLQNANTLNPLATPEESTTYTLTGDIGECTGLESQVRINVIDNPINPPKAFTPNGDGVNDTWEIGGMDAFPNAIVEVFNRWGQRVFITIGYNIPWDGTRDGTPLTEGTYYWVIQLNNPNVAVSNIETGYVAIIR
jgi:gliding motility-associated-like protein